MKRHIGHYRELTHIDQHNMLEDIDGMVDVFNNTIIEACRRAFTETSGEFPQFPVPYWGRDCACCCKLRKETCFTTV